MIIKRMLFPFLIDADSRVMEGDTFEVCDVVLVSIRDHDRVAG